jgi:hypothetical protein
MKDGANVERRLSLFQTPDHPLCNAIMMKLLQDAKVQQPQQSLPCPALSCPALPGLALPCLVYHNITCHSMS